MLASFASFVQSYHCLWKVLVEFGTKLVDVSFIHGRRVSHALVMHCVLGSCAAGELLLLRSWRKQASLGQVSDL